MKLLSFPSHVLLALGWTLLATSASAQLQPVSIASSQHDLALRFGSFDAVEHLADEVLGYIAHLNTTSAGPIGGSSGAIR